ncbi:MAG: phosphoribosyltransferase family protein [Candidatus Micrarchaeota archaeon]
MFKDRHEAGEALAKALSRFRGRDDAVILAIPRGALQIGEVLHDRLGLPLDIIVTKKISHPMSEEFAIGAVGPDGEHFLSVGALEVDPAYIIKERRRLSGVVEDKYRRYRGDRPKPDLAGKTVIIVDDGIATGSTMLTAIRVIRKQRPKGIIVAVPVGPPDALMMLAREADKVVCLSTPTPFFAIGQFYEDFPQVEDKEAIAILKRCRR